VLTVVSHIEGLASTFRKVVLLFGAAALGVTATTGAGCAAALRDAGADVVMSERAVSHGTKLWRQEFPLMVAWAFER
jgi:hypothetical protein